MKFYELPKIISSAFLPNLRVNSTKKGAWKTARFTFFSNATNSTPFSQETTLCFAKGRRERRGRKGGARVWTVHSVHDRAPIVKVRVRHGKKETSA